MKTHSRPEMEVHKPKGHRSVSRGHDSHEPEYTKQEAEKYYAWQLSWKSYIAKSVIYIDANTGSTEFDASSMPGGDKHRTLLKMLCFKFHARVVDFFNADEVTIIISRRPFDKTKEYPPNDLFYHHKRIRIWSFEKAMKFFSRLSHKIQLPPEVYERVKREKGHGLGGSRASEAKILEKGKEKEKPKNEGESKEQELKETATKEQGTKEVEIEDHKPKIQESKHSRDQLELVESNIPIQAEKLDENAHGNKENEGIENEKRPLAVGDNKPLQEKPLQEKHQTNIMRGTEKNSKRLLIESLRKAPTGQMKQPALPQKLNYQQEVFKRILNQKSQSLTPKYKKSYRQPVKSSAPIVSDKLATLLTKEKLYGPTDRDMSVKSHDFHYFERPFLFLYDLKQQYRPIIAKEWPMKDTLDSSETGTWARMYRSADGRSLFVKDTTDYSSASAVKRRETIFQNRKKLREKLRKLFTFSNLQVEEDPEETDKIELIKKDDTMELDNLQEVTPEASRVNFCDQDIKKRTFNEMNASGITQSYSQSRFFTTSALAKAGLGITRSHVASKEFKSLEKRIYEKDRKEAESVLQAKKIGGEKKRPRIDDLKFEGYCENCRIRYEKFDEHIMEPRHREFATNPKNFMKIDRFIEMLQMSGVEEEF